MTTRIVVVDDQALVRTGFAMIIGAEPDLEVVGEAADGLEALTVVAATRPDVVLMDIRMPELDGVEATRRLTAPGVDHPTRVLILTTFDLDDYVFTALRAGASGFLLKDTPPATIVEAVQRVVDGEPILSPSVTAQLIRQVAESSPASPADRASVARIRLAELSDRELEVAMAVGAGKSNAEIAAELFMSVATVKAHVSRILTKLDAANRVQVAIAVHDADLA